MPWNQLCNEIRLGCECDGQWRAENRDLNADLRPFGTFQWRESWVMEGGRERILAHIICQ